MLYLAIDQHAKQLTVNLRNEQGAVVLRRQVSTQPDKVREFFASLSQTAEPEGGYVAILEVCGFNDWERKRGQVSLFRQALFGNTIRRLNNERPVQK